MNMPRMRTLAEAYKAIKAEDPSTSFTMTALRRLAASGTLPCVRSGSKYLVDLDTLSEYLKAPDRFQKHDTIHKMEANNHEGK